MKGSRRSGRSLFEMCVVAVMLVLSTACLAPAVVQFWEKDAHVRSMNNLRLIGLALHNYSDTLGALPPGNDGKNFSVHARLLPYIEQGKVFKAIDFDKPSDDKANAEAAATLIKFYVSPRDSLEAKNGQGVTNYLFNAGSKYALADNDGAFIQNQAIKIIDISVADGTANTIMVGETLRGDPNSKADDVKRRHVQLGDKDALKNLKEESGVTDFKDGKNLAANRGSRWIDGRFLQTTFTGTRAFNDAKPDVDCNGLGGLSALRSDDDIVLVGMCDGSARKIKTSIKFSVWKALVTRNGSEILGPNDY
jgi:hypothetical protein